MIKKIEFDYEPTFSTGEIHNVQARVFVGKTSARGDEPTEVIELSMFNSHDRDLDIDDDLYEELCDKAIEQAKYA